MAKYYGKIGYAITTETKPGVWTNGILERVYYGDVIRNTRRLTNQQAINDSVDISQEISVVRDAYAYAHFHLIRYVTYGGVKWKVTSITVERPRLVLSIGGLYNEADER